MQQDAVNRKFGPYICTKLIGSGGQSAVYDAYHEETQRKVALRAMSVNSKDVDVAMQECMYVLDEVTAVNAPHTVQVEDYGSEDATLYIALTYMGGGSLQTRMQQRYIEDESEQTPHLPAVGEVLAMTERLAESLDILHDHGVVHGQLGPRNIMFDEDGDAYLSDIGLTRLMKILFRLDSTNSFNMTKYSAPELWDGEKPVPASDQYALACIVYQLLTGKAPFEAPSIFGLMQAHANDVAAPPHYIRKDLPGTLSMVFWQALAKPTDRRFKSVMAFYQDLAGTLQAYRDEPTDFFTFEVN